MSQVLSLKIVNIILKISDKPLDQYVYRHWYSTYKEYY